MPPRERADLALDAGTVDEGPGVGGEAAHRTADVVVDLKDLLDAGGFHERTSEALLARQHTTLGGGDADGGRTMLPGGNTRVSETTPRARVVGRSVHWEYLNGLDGVLDLDEATLRRKGVDATVILAPLRVDTGIKTPSASFDATKSRFHSIEAGTGPQYRQKHGRPTREMLRSHLSRAAALGHR